MNFNEYTFGRDLLKSESQIEEAVKLIENNESPEVIAELLGNLFNRGKRPTMAPVSRAAMHRGEYDGNYSGSRPNFTQPKFVGTQGSVDRQDAQSKYDVSPDEFNKGMNPKVQFLSGLRNLFQSLEQPMRAAHELTSRHKGLFKNSSTFPENMSKVYNWFLKIQKAIENQNWGNVFQDKDKANYANVDTGVANVNKAPDIYQSRKHFWNP